ncbi:MAG: flagellar basal body P-ring formation chaperone FlgA [bacterium]
MRSFSAILLPIAAAASMQAADLGSITAPLANAPVNPTAASFQKSEQAAPAVVTSPGMVTLGERQVLDALQRELAARYSLEGDLKLSFVQEWKPLEIRNGRDWKLIVDQAPLGGISSRPQLRFHIEADGKQVGSWQESFRASLWRPVWVASRRLDRGAALDSSSCALKTLDTLAENLSYVAADTDLSNYEMAQGVGQDRPLTSRDLTLRPLVRKNQLVDVIVSEGALNITMKGLALGTAGAGEMVSIRNPDSRKDFQAKVIGANTVQVKF